METPKPSLDGIVRARQRAKKPQPPTKPHTPLTTEEVLLASEISAKQPANSPKKRRWLKKAALASFAVLLLAVGYVGYTFFSASSKVFKGNPIDAIIGEEKQLKTDQHGRSNILLFGTSEDDPGHPGAALADSIMVLSIHQERKEAFMVSIPRDLNVQYGRTCIGGTRGLINDVYQCAKTSAGADEEGAQTAMRQKVGEVLGLDLQYSVHVNYTALKQLVDAVGGITVMIESDNPRGIYERYVKLPNGPANLNGEAALALARARNAEGGFGLSRSNFDREQYQQKILIALKEKAVSAGTIMNPVAVNSLITALGDNVRSNFNANEIKTLSGLGKDIPQDKITRLDLNKPETMLLRGDGNPVAGDYNYKDIQAYLQAWASGNHAALEKPTVAVYNASGQPGMAQTKADELEATGFTVVAVATTAKGSLTGVAWFDQSAGKKPESLKKLQQTLGSQPQTVLPPALSSNADFIVVIAGE